MTKHYHKTVILVSLLILGAVFYFSDRNPEVLKAGTGDNVSGWAWSSNIGWVSFNCTNDNSCAQSNYGVNMDRSTGLFSGYAWSPNIGWISFNSPGVSGGELAGCPTAPCEARVSGGLIGSFPKNVTGWAKVLSSNSWMSLRGTNYGVQLESSGDFSGWSWEDMNIGWMSWSGPNYAVYASAIVLTVTKPGDGSGTVTGPGINCGDDCTEFVSSGTSVTLTAVPEPGSIFTGWTGCGSVTPDNKCVVTVSASRVVIANFKKAALPSQIKEVRPQ